MSALSNPATQQPSTLPDIDRIHAAQTRRRTAIGASTVEQRRAKIQALERAVLARREDIRAAIYEDLRKPPEEVDLSEIFAVISEARHARRHLGRWMKGRRVRGRLALLTSSSRIVHEPKGLVLIISPWNFPLNLTFGPLVSAIAAGNCVMIKPSELAPATARLMKEIISGLFDESEVAMIEGDARTAQALLQKKFDHIFFTGSPAVGRIVMQAAAKHLTSVTLELGGKSPVIVDRTADLDEAASKIAWGKVLNSGQTCIAPDYLLVDETIRDAFVAKLFERLDSMSTADTGVLINERHASRVRGLLDSAVAAGARVIHSGAATGNPRAVPLTALSDVPVDAPLMQEEIFGPLLPIQTYRSLDDAIRMIDSREKPLVLYIFSRSKKVIREIIARTSAGGTVVNHALIHFFQLNLPFGGVGQSGMGKGHGFAGFQAFTNERGVLEQRTRFSPIQLMFPPYTKLKKKLIDLTLRFF